MRKARQRKGFEGVNTYVTRRYIAEDLYPRTEVQLQPLIQACSETLLRYRELCYGNAIMDGNILLDGDFEVMLSPGLGKHFREREKQNLFNDAHKIAELLLDVMERRSKELEEGTYPGPQTVTHKTGRTGMASEGLEALGREQQRVEKFARLASQRPGLTPLIPEDLPDGVVATPGYDHRGHCLAFTHETLGHLGKIVFSVIGTETLMEAELSKDDPQHSEQKKAVLEEIIAVIETGFRNIPALKNR